MTGCCLVAWTSAQAMRWVNEIFSRRPAAWSAGVEPPPPLLQRRRPGATRKVVAVGTVRLSFMLATSLAGGPFDRAGARR